MRSQRGRVVVLTTLTFVMSTLVGLSPVSAGETEQGADSPEGVIARLQVAAEAEDFTEMVACMAPRDRPMAAMGMIIGAGMMAGFSDDTEALTAEFEAILDKHKVNLDEDEGAPPAETDEEIEENLRKMFEGVDLGALIGDIMAFMNERIPDAKTKKAVPEGDLGDVQIDGDTATATIGDEVQHFVRVDGRWYIRMKD